ncbi:MAG: ATP-binding protein, partial [Victivallaceae bacterium]|nr:ATP-binding protein [Victivallaceae bacterium]
RLVSKELHGNDNFSSAKDSKANKGWVPSFRFGNSKSALANLPADEERFPVSTWLKNFLIDGVQNFMLNSLALRKASPFAKQRGFELDGSNLPWVVQRLKEEAPERFQLWIEHLQTALPELKNIKTVERPDDKHCYLVYEYSQGFEVPSWCASDGTLRLTALTLPAYLPDSTGVFLVEEPENGIHPDAIETVIDSLSSVYGGQVFLASHSPIVLSKISPESVLCFSKNKTGATTIVRGDQHPRLKKWQGNIDFKTLFANGVLG